ncbi:MAG: hypothetical protein A2817_03505 [Candidatus Yanofskybacteria bacterium RIFCSPHIGHO2_01_FULL_39_8b]|uniref:Uncharacterized protein n=1 Tax=Candidatus Yanofskybacteria bacterium RIFCSPHIGHO2_01_FULL_39_8b TaxID=1802659 RepID=A0A1F8EIM0_9BACT|nr:MAG: hypothetical protein A2817_03505 [Candidatus Yanofskybacteria bacterium RIFCSPHIGHO2_01_FULL_39_8b]
MVVNHPESGTAKFLMELNHVKIQVRITHPKPHKFQVTSAVHNGRRKELGDSDAVRTYGFPP